MLVDSHCHLNMMPFEKYQQDVATIVEEAVHAGVKCILCVGTNTDTSHQAVAIAEQFSMVYASVGVHPSDEPESGFDAAELKRWADHPKVKALGETGLDYHYNSSGLEAMRERFRLHIQVAREVRKPIIIHTRAAREDTISIMLEENAADCGGVMHCFTESIEMAKEAMALGFYISFSGIITFKNAKELQEVVRQVPLESMLIETDAPYLTPVPFRGKPNKPEYVRYVAEKIAEIKGIDYETVVGVTANNFSKLFDISLSD